MQSANNMNKEGQFMDTTPFFKKRPNAPFTLSRTGSQRTSPYMYQNIVSGGAITSPSDLGDRHTGTYLQRTWAGCHEQGTNIKRIRVQFNQQHVTE